MKGFHLCFSLPLCLRDLCEKFLPVLIIPLVLAGCAEKNSSVKNGLSPEFFERKIEGEISVSAFNYPQYKEYLESAATLFEEIYPGTKVTIEPFSVMPRTMTFDEGTSFSYYTEEESNHQTHTDYINRLNTKIMSGAGADIIATDIIPLGKFINGGAFEDLEPYMKADPEFNYSDYRQNIFEASRYRDSKGNDGIWYLPMDYCFLAYSYNSKLVPPHLASGLGINAAVSTEDLFAIGIPLFDGSYRILNGYEEGKNSSNLFALIFEENYHNFVDYKTGRVNFTDGRFSELLVKAIDWTRRGYIPPPFADQLESEKMRDDYNQGTFFFKQGGIINLMFNFLDDTNPRVMRYYLEYINRDEKIAGIRANTDGSVPYSNLFGFGINSMSKNKAVSWAFIKFLLSKESQVSQDIFRATLPVNNEARMENYNTVYLDVYKLPFDTLNEKQRKGLEDYIAAIESLSDLINGNLIWDTNIFSVVYENVRYYIDGTRTADEVARIIQSKVDLYLSE